MVFAAAARVSEARSAATTCSGPWCLVVFLFLCSCSRDEVTPLKRASDVGGKQSLSRFFFVPEVNCTSFLSQRRQIEDESRLIAIWQHGTAKFNRNPKSTEE